MRPINHTAHVLHERSMQPEPCLPQKKRENKSLHETEYLTRRPSINYFLNKLLSIAFQGFRKVSPRSRLQFYIRMQLRSRMETKVRATQDKAAGSNIKLFI